MKEARTSRGSQPWRRAASVSRCSSLAGPGVASGWQWPHVPLWSPELLLLEAGAEVLHLAAQARAGRTSPSASRGPGNQPSASLDQFCPGLLPSTQGQAPETPFAASIVPVATENYDAEDSARVISDLSPGAIECDVDSATTHLSLPGFLPPARLGRVHGFHHPREAKRERN